jgi:hypothetical protein
MAILEPNDFDKMKDPEWVKLQRKADKLKKIRAKQRHDEETKSALGIPTSMELEQQFNYGIKEESGDGPSKEA